MIPSEEEALALHRKYGSSDIIVRHCRVVTRVALTLAKGLQSAGMEVDLDIVKAAGLLHDIGRTITHTVSHGLEGSKLLEREGVDDRVVQAVRRHVGAGLSKEEAKALGLPDHDYIPRSLEERIVCFADKMVGSDRAQPFGEEVSRFVKKGHDVKRLIALKKGLERELGADPEKFVLDNLKESH